jgi:hypothetical protein
LAARPFVQYASGMSETPPPPYRPRDLVCEICGHVFPADPAEQEAAEEMERAFPLAPPGFICEGCAKDLPG